MKISVIVCTRNRLTEIVNFTGTLLQQTELPDEYVIVDSSDTPIDRTDKYANQILNDAVPVKYFHTTPGLTHQRNIGVEKCIGDIIYFFDDDIILEKDYLKVINDTFRANSSYWGAMGDISNTQRPGIQRRIEFLLRSFFLLQRSFGDGKFRCSGLPQHPYGTTEFIETEVLAGGLTAYRREVFDEYSFDASLTGYSYMEDVDFSRRVSYKHKLCFNPKAKCQHRHSPPKNDELRRRCRMYMVNHRYLFYKNFLLQNKGSLLGHYWSIVGLLVVSFLFNSSKATFGYWAGMREFHKRKKELLSGISGGV